MIEPPGIEPPWCRSAPRIADRGRPRRRRGLLINAATTARNDSIGHPLGEPVDDAGPLALDTYNVSANRADHRDPRDAVVVAISAAVIPRLARCQRRSSRSRSPRHRPPAMTHRSSQSAFWIRPEALNRPAVSLKAGEAWAAVTPSPVATAATAHMEGKMSSFLTFLILGSADNQVSPPSSSSPPFARNPL